MFHADPHPGNVLVLSDGQLAQIDFGSVGRLHLTQRIALARLLIAIERDDPQLLTDALLELAAAARPVDLDALERALAQFLAQRMGPGTTPGAELFASLLSLLSGFGLAFDPQLAGLFRAIVTIEGTLRTLDPAFELVPEVKRLSGQADPSLFGPEALANTIASDLGKLAPILRALPRKAHHIATAMERNEWGANVRLLADERDVRLLTRLADRAILAVLSAAIGVISAMLIGVNGGVNVAHRVSLAHVVGYIGLAVATIIGLRVLVAVTRDRTV